MRNLLSGGLMMVAGMVSLPTPATNTVVSTTEYQSDPRLKILERFFQRQSCPAARFAEDFLRAADTYKLDWRLLPSISLVESGGGREAKNNNLFGWGSVVFPSINVGIHAVASRLANSHLYRDKSLDEILWTYNPREHYPGLVKSIMRRIAPAE
jgi:hypothetical protein